MLARAARFLRELPHGRDDAEHVRAQFRSFKAAHPTFRVDLLVDQPPGSLNVDYDMLLGHPDGGTVALSWRPDNATPWSVMYADHWAANYVVTVNNHAFSVQDALLFLKLASGQYPDLMTEMVNHALVAQAIAEQPSRVTKKELQAAADEFRSLNHLDSTEATHRWLKETGLSLKRLEELLTQLVRRQKLEQQVVLAKLIREYFRTHRTEFDVLRFFQVSVEDKTMAEHLVKSSRKKGLLYVTHSLMGKGRSGLTGSLMSRHIFELPCEFAKAAVGKILGPVREGNVWWIAEIMMREPARLDSHTRAAIRAELFQEWLTKRRSEAAVRWHWM